MFLTDSFLSLSDRLRKIAAPLVGLGLLSLSAFSQDITVKSISLINTQLNTGSYITPTAIITNLGSSTSSYFSTGFYLSSDTVYDKKDVYLNSYSVYGLYKGSDEVLYTSSYVPSDYPAGKYFLLVVTDIDNYISESNERNNSKYLAVEILPPSIDLSVKNLSLSNNTLSPGQAASISYEIKNSGTTSTSYTSTGFYLSTDTILSTSFDKYLSYASEYSISGGSYTVGYGSLQLPNNISEGSYYLLASADYQNLVKETNEKNNTGYVKLVVGKSDLIIKSPTISDVSVPAGSSVSGYCFLSNVGIVNVSNVRTGYYLSTDTLFNAIGDVFLSQSYAYSLAPGATIVQNASLAIPESIPVGEYYLLFVADDDNAFSEKNESNNTNYLKIKVTTTDYDLSISDLVVSPSASAGSLQNITCNIYNNGKSNSSAFEVKFYLSSNTSWSSDDVLLLSTNEAGIMGNSNSLVYNSFTLPANTADGTYYIIATVDPDNDIDEKNESNNSSYKAFTVGKPDLQITSLNLSSDKIDIGSEVSLFYFLNNRGTSAALNVSVGYYISADKTFDPGADQFIGDYYDYYYYNVNGGSSIFKNAMTNKIKGLGEGAYYILVVADYLNQIVETDETNNTAFTPIRLITPDVDLVISNPALSSTSVGVGDYLNITSNVKNAGTSNAGGNYTYYYLSNDTVFNSSEDKFLGNSYINEVAAGATIQQLGYSNVIPSVATGTYYVLLVADQPNDIAEKNEKNNFAYTVIKVKGASIDLAVSNPVLSKSSATAGSYISLSNTLQNFGSSYVSYNYTGYYLSKDTILDRSSDVFLSEQSSYGLYGYDRTTQYGSFYLPYSADKGKYYILFVADYTNSIFEEAETNNVTYASISITSSSENGTPDLFILRHSPDKFVVRPLGDTIAITMSVSNFGSGTTSADFYTNVYLSKDTSLSDNDVALDYYLTSQYLSSYDTASFRLYVTFSQSIAPGSYYLIYKADVYNNVKELSEYNNTAYDKITIDKITSALHSEGEALINLYPNPASDFLSVETKNLMNLSDSWHLTNTLGGSVSIQPERAGDILKFNLETLQLSKGLYILRNDSNGHIIEKKFTIQ